MRATIALTVLLTGLSFARAGAMETKDIVRLTKLHLEEEVIIAQIRVTGSKFSLSTEDIVRLKTQGVADKVIQAMIDMRPLLPERNMLA